MTWRELKEKLDKIPKEELDKPAIVWNNTDDINLIVTDCAVDADSTGIYFYIEVED